MAGHQICKAFAPKYASGLQNRELYFRKCTFLQIAQSNSVAELVQSVAELTWFGGRKMSKLECENKQQIRWPNCKYRWPNSDFFKLQIFVFCGFQLHESQ